MTTHTFLMTLRHKAENMNELLSNFHNEIVKKQINPVRSFEDERFSPKCCELFAKVITCSAINTELHVYIDNTPLPNILLVQGAQRSYIFL